MVSKHTQSTSVASDSVFLQHMIGSSEARNPVVSLLEEIHACGSINQAAKSVGMSYKAAWERIENINNLSPDPLISRQVGGSGGGGTVLTEAGHEFIKRARLLQREFASFLNFFYFSPVSLFDGQAEHDRYLDSSLLGGGWYCNIRDGGKYPQLRSLIEVLISELQHRGEGWLFSSNSLLRSIMVMLCRDRENRDAPAKVAACRQDVQRLAPALQRITADYARKITVGELARLCCMSNCTFYRIFYRTFGKSPQDYIIQYRLQMGAYLLRHKNIGIMEIAAAVGYDSTSSFHRHFRSIYGKTPRDYRLSID